MTIENSFKIEIINKIHKSLSTLLYIIYIYIYIHIPTSSQEHKT